MSRLKRHLHVVVECDAHRANGPFPRFREAPVHAANIPVSSSAHSTRNQGCEMSSGCSKPHLTNSARSHHRGIAVETGDTRVAVLPEMPSDLPIGAETDFTIR